MTERCIDASVVVKWAIESEPHRDKALELLNDSAVSSIALIAPSLLSVEADSAVRKRAFLGLLTPDEARKAYAILDAAPIQIVEEPGMRQRARELAEQFNQRLVYDALYAALAEIRGCEFWTADEDFYKDVKAALAFVKHLPDYP